jgi:hypothetical protein
MKIKTVLQLLIVIICLAQEISFGQNTTDESVLVKLGVSKIDITPEKPTVMGGYGFRTSVSTGIHDHLYASALYFTGDKTQTLIITADLLGFTTNFVDDLRTVISSKIGISSENIIITAVHTHGGPGTRYYETDTLQTVEGYLKILKEKLTLLAIDATKNITPVQMGIGNTVCNMNINRRAVKADGRIGLGRNPDGVCDHKLVVIKFADLNNKTRAILVNWPCHGTASGPDNYQITGDWPGATASYLRDLAGNDVIVAVTAGASADINPIYGPGNNFKEIENIGFQVGKEAWKVLLNMPVYPLNSLNSVNTVMTLPGKKTSLDELPHTSYESAPDTKIKLTVLRIGSLLIAGISGELMTEIGLEIKSLSPFPETIIVTHCNGSSGYICTDKAFKEGGYEVSVTKLQPGAEKLLISKYQELIKSL